MIMNTLFSWFKPYIALLNERRTAWGFTLSFRIKLLIKFCLTVLGVLSMSVLTQEAKLAFLALQRIDPVPRVQQLLQENRYAEADQYLQFFMDFDYVKTNPIVLNLKNKIEEERSSWLYKVKKVGEGLWKGESDEQIGQAAGVVSDFLLIGDLRDLGKEATKYVKGEENDPIIISLSSFGLVADVATAVSGTSTVGTAGATSSVTAVSASMNVGASMIKILHKAGKLPKWLFNAIIDAAKVKDFDRVKDIMLNLGNLSKYRGSMKLVAESKHADDLPKLLKFAEIFGDEAVIMYEIGGQTALKMTQKLGQQSKYVMKAAASYGKEGLILLDKLGVKKFTKYSRGYKSFIHTKKIFHLLSKWLIRIPNNWLYLIVLLSVIIWLPYTWVCKKIRVIIPKFL